MPGADVPLIPRTALFGNAAYLKPAISPDGTRLFYLAPDDGVLNVWTAPIGRLQEARPLTRDHGRGVETFVACHDDRTVCYRRDEDGDENWRIYLLDLESGRERCVTPFTGVQARLLAHNRWHPDTMLIGLNKDQTALHDVYRLSLSAGELVKTAGNPGYLSWLIDSELRIRGGTVTGPGGSLAVHLAEPGPGQALPPPQVPWLEVPYEDRAGTAIVGFSRDGTILHVLSSVGAETSRLIAIDIATRQQTILAGDPAYDLSRVVLDPARRTPQAVVVAKDRDHWMFLDESFATDVKRIRGELDRLGLDGELFLDRSERSGRLWIVCVVLPDGPARYYIYHQAAGRLEFLFSHQPELGHYRLSRMEPFAFRARDGVTVHGYVTWPPGTERRGLPAVVNVHGGPWARNYFDLNEEGQWLANRGYACVQVNFRGSTGSAGASGSETSAPRSGAPRCRPTCSTRYLISLPAAPSTPPGSRSWAARTGGMRPWRARPSPRTRSPLRGRPVRSGESADPARAWGTVPEPHAVVHVRQRGEPRDRARDAVGPVPALPDRRHPHSHPGRAGGQRRAGDPERGRADRRALKAKGLPHEYLLFPDEGHGLMKAKNREIYYEAVERFLPKHLNPGEVEALATLKTRTRSSG